MFFSAKGQKVDDTLVTFIDTINVHGQVINLVGKPLADVTVVYGNDQSVKTDSAGYFYLNGVNPVERLIFDSPTGRTYFTNKGSRYILIKLNPNPITAINASNDQVFINAKKIKEKPRYKQVTIIQKNKTYNFDGGLFMGEKQAEYAGGMIKFYAFINKNLVYPELAIQSSIEGLVTVCFAINSAGYPEDFSVINDLGYGCADEVITVLKSMGRWNPKISNGKPLKAQFTLNIPFKLID